MDRRAFLEATIGVAAGAGLAGSGNATEVTAPDMEGSVAFTVILEVRPGHEDEFLRLLTPVLDAMRHEPTFISAVLHRDPEDPTRFMIYETWSDLDDVVQVQLGRAYRQAYTDRLPAILREERQIAIWKPVRGDFSFSTGDQWRNRGVTGIAPGPGECASSVRSRRTHPAGRSSR